MKSILLVYPPFCTPASPPYSITGIYAFLKNNLPSDYSLSILDLNVSFHVKAFPEDASYYQSFSEDFDSEEYDKRTREYIKRTGKVYSENNKKVRSGELPDQFETLYQEIRDKKPTLVGISIVFSSQAFYTFALINKLKEDGIRVIIGGPAVNDKLKAAADGYSLNEVDFLSIIIGKEVEHDKLNCEIVPDFSIYPYEKYFTSKPYIPIRTSSTCYYQKCGFCSHHGGGCYFEYPLESIEKGIIASKPKGIFFTDDMIHKKRLLAFADMLEGKNITWMCQLRPTEELDRKTLQRLYDCGLKVIIWGVESGCDRVLKKMRKGTTVASVDRVLTDAHDIGITNVLYIMFGFPTETKDEFLETIAFLKEHNECIDLISTSVFGLQKGTPVYTNPEEYNITAIHESERQLLDVKITYDVSSGMSHDEAVDMRERYKKTIEGLNKYPKRMNFFREHLLSLL